MVEQKLPRVIAGDKPKRFPVRCSYCQKKLDNLREVQTHMRNAHPA